MMWYKFTLWQAVPTEGLRRSFASPDHLPGTLKQIPQLVKRLL